MLLGTIKPLIKDKTKELTNSDNFRPIMISSSLFRLFELCLRDDLEQKIDTNPRQFGFKKGSSCAMATSMLQEIIELYNSKCSNVLVTFIDLSKAYDKVNNNILINKMIEKEINPKIVRIFKYMNENSYAKVCYNNVSSDEFKIGNSVRQGGVTSPLLFSLYIDEILNKINSVNHVMLGHLAMNMLAYADDLCLISLNVNAMQAFLDIVSLEINKLNLQINTDKTVLMCFQSKKCQINLDFNKKLNIGCEKIKQVEKVKYLGFWLDENSTYKDDVEYRTLTFNRQFFSLFRKLHFLETDNLLFLFKSYCMSFYSATNWYSLTNCKPAFEHLKVLYHKHIKKIFNVNKYHSNHQICKQANLLTFPHLINTKVLHHFRNLIFSNNPCFKQLRYYFEHDSLTVTKFKNHFESIYGINDIFYNDLDALHSRIQFIEDREPISNFYAISYNHSNV